MMHTSRFLSPRLFPAFALSALAAFALLTAVHAQSLTLGDPNGYETGQGSAGSGIISGSGTTTSGTFAYSDGASSATSDYKSVEVTGDVALHAGGSITDLTIDNLSTATIDGGHIGVLTTLTPGYFYIYDDTLNISGGTIDTLRSNPGIGGYGDKSTISGGHIGAFSSRAGLVTITGGSLDSLALNTGYVGDGAYVAAIANISGGSVGSVDARGGIDDFGGGYHDGILYADFTTCTISGGVVGPLTASYYGGYDLIGTDLRFIGNNRITGFLSDGDAIDTTFTNTDGNGFMKFNGVAAVPEVSTLISFGLLLALGLGGAVFAKEKSTLGSSSPCSLR